MRPYGQSEVLACAWGQGRGEEKKLARKASLLAPKWPLREHLALSLAGSKSGFFRAWRVKLIFRVVRLLIKLPKRIRLIRKLACGSARKGVPTYPWGCGEGLVLFCMETRVNRRGDLVSMDSR